MRGHCSRSRKRPGGKMSGRAIALDDGRTPQGESSARRVAGGVCFAGAALLVELTCLGVRKALSRRFVVAISPVRAGP
jgi:hypothetical protein